MGRGKEVGGLSVSVARSLSLRLAGVSPAPRSVEYGLSSGATPKGHTSDHPTGLGKSIITFPPRRVNLRCGRRGIRFSLVNRARGY